MNKENPPLTPAPDKDTAKDTVKDSGQNMADVLDRQRAAFRIDMPVTKAQRVDRLNPNRSAGRGDHPVSGPAAADPVARTPILPQKARPASEPRANSTTGPALNPIP